MQNTLKQQQLLSLGIPEDEYEHHIFLCPLQLHKNSKLHLKLSLLIDKYVDETKGGRVGERLEEFKCHWQWVLLGLSRSIITYSCQSHLSLFTFPFLLKVFDMNGKSSVSDTSIAENNGTLCTNSSFCPPKTPITRDAPKTGRDEPCICGNGRKFRKRR